LALGLGIASLVAFGVIMGVYYGLIFTRH
jgi:hypothetical protein